MGFLHTDVAVDVRLHFCLGRERKNKIFEIF